MLDDSIKYSIKILFYISVYWRIVEECENLKSKAAKMTDSYVVNHCFLWIYLNVPYTLYMSLHFLIFFIDLFEIKKTYNYFMDLMLVTFHLKLTSEV